ncbi:MAG: substrate-binding domain-containing protein, partial [Propionibacteriaceae bacterium]
GVTQVLQWLERRGHHEVAFVGGPAQISTAAERLRAWLDGRATHGLSSDYRLIDAGDFLADGSAAAMQRILDRGVAPTAVVGANGPTTLGVLRALREHFGADRASRIEIVSLDDVEWFELASPPISAVRNDAAAIGRLGVDAVVGLLGGHQAESRRIPTEFIDRSGV